MQAEERQRRIDDYLQKVEFASLDELSELVDASTSTVRRDLTILESRGSLKRTHGGARLVNPKSDEFNFSTRDTHQLNEKEIIGRACANLVQPHQTVIVDAGTTCYHVARYLEPKTPQIITNSLPVANLFASSNKVEVVVSGGVLYPRLDVLVGPMTVEAFQRIRADIAIMSCGGLTLDGFTNSHGLLIDIQLAMIDAAQKVVFCIDATKFGRLSMSKLCPLERVDTLVTNAGAPPDMLDAMRQRGLEVVVAQNPPALK